MGGGGCCLLFTLYYTYMCLASVYYTSSKSKKNPALQNSNYWIWLRFWRKNRIPRVKAIPRNFRPNYSRIMGNVNMCTKYEVKWQKHWIWWQIILWWTKPNCSLENDFVSSESVVHFFSWSAFPKTRTHKKFDCSSSKGKVFGLYQLTFIHILESWKCSQKYLFWPL